jgi:hypothetical protein
MISPYGEKISMVKENRMKIVDDFSLWGKNIHG